MGTPFLEAFSRALVSRLVADGQLALASGSVESVATFLARDLAAANPGRSLVTSVSRALLACPDVEDLFVDDVLIKRVIDDLGVVRG